MRGQLRTGLNVIAAVLAIVVVGTVGYTLIEGWSLLDSLFMTVTTIFTVGFGEVHPLSRGGQIFTLLLIIGGVGTILYGLGRMVEFVIGGQLSGMFRRRAVRRQVDKLDSHFIVCGYGRVGEAVARHFAAHGSTVTPRTSPVSSATASCLSVVTPRPTRCSRPRASSGQGGSWPPWGQTRGTSS
jgi:hypothetical protein